MAGLSGENSERRLRVVDRRNGVPISTVRKDLFYKAGRFDEVTKTPKDWVFFSKLACMKARFKFLPDITWSYTQVKYEGRMWDADMS